MIQTIPIQRGLLRNIFLFLLPIDLLFLLTAPLTHPQSPFFILGLFYLPCSLLLLPQQRIIINPVDRTIHYRVALLNLTLRTRCFRFSSIRKARYVQQYRNGASGHSLTRFIVLEIHDCDITLCHVITKREGLELTSAINHHLRAAPSVSPPAHLDAISSP